MYLIIDNTEKNKLVLRCALGKKLLEEEFITSSNGELLSQVVNFFSAHGLSIRKLRGLAVIVGQGSFTAARVAITMANTLAYAWRLPVVGLKKFSSMASAVARIKSSPVGRLARAEYSGEPRIGK